jgi:hypothetical protein
VAPSRATFWPSIWTAKRGGRSQRSPRRTTSCLSPTVASLVKLIQAIRDEPTRISRGYWVGLWNAADPDELRTADAQWKSVAESHCRHFDPEIADTDFELLGATASGVKSYTEEQVAHADAAAASAKDHPVSTTLSASCLSAAPNTS